MIAREVKSKDELGHLAAFLKASNLPFQDLHLDGNVFFCYHSESGKMIGSGGLEFYSHHALLRSISVAPDERGKSIGREIVKDLLIKSRERSVEKVFLLIETAGEFFKNLGFQEIPTENAPDTVKASSEFRTVCPAAAACLEMAIGASFQIL